MLPRVRIVCEKGHWGSVHKDQEDAQSYLGINHDKKCCICGSKNLTWEGI